MKKHTIFLVVFIIIFTSISIVKLRFTTEPVGAHKADGKGLIRIEDYQHIDKDPLNYLDLWEQLDKNPEGVSQEVLEKLALRIDGIGYQSNLILAHRSKNKGVDPSNYYQRANQLVDSKEDKQALAQYLQEQQRDQDAIDLYLELLPNENINLKLIELGVESTKIASALIEKRQLTLALEFLEEQLLQEANPEIKVRLQKQYGSVLAGLGKYKEAVEVLEKVENTTIDSETSWWWARSLENTGKTEKAKEVYQQLGTKGAYRRGLILEKEGKLEQAAEEFSKSEEDGAQWRGAKLWEVLGKRERALDIYKSLAGEEGTYQRDAAYRAYILMGRNNRNNHQEADEMLKVLEKHPAWMNRLGKPTLWEHIVEVSYEKPVFIQKVDIFKELGKEELANLELIIGEKNAQGHEKLALGDWYLQREEYYIAVKWGIRALREEKSRRAYELTYQRPYENYVREAAIKYNIDPYLIWAVMREESHYRKDAKSWVGALGLMQIMPATGQEIASRLKTSIMEEDLLNPEINIEFGAFYLKRLLDMFEGDEDKALAAYNGGSGNVRRWSQSKLGTKKEDFPTAITFLETQRYITKVKNTYYIYKWFYGE